MPDVQAAPVEAAAISGSAAKNVLGDGPLASQVGVAGVVPVPHRPVEGHRETATLHHRYE